MLRSRRVFLFSVPSTSEFRGVANSKFSLFFPFSFVLEVFSSTRPFPAPRPPPPPPFPPPLLTERLRLFFFGLRRRNKLGYALMVPSALSMDEGRRASFFPPPFFPAALTQGGPLFHTISCRPAALLRTSSLALLRCVDLSGFFFRHFNGIAAPPPRSSLLVPFRALPRQDGFFRKIRRPFSGRS